MKRSILALFLLAASAAGCRDTINIIPTTPTPLPTTPAERTRIEFRVLGNATSVRVRYSSPTDGLAQVITTLPYSNSFSTAANLMFLSLEVTPIAYVALERFPFLSIQIVVNGNVFREATSNELYLNTLSVSGTWRQ